jgi:hypothetical protein
MGAECAVRPAAATVRNVVLLLVEVFRIAVHVQSCAGRRGKVQQRKRFSAASTLLMVRIGQGERREGRSRRGCSER